MKLPKETRNNERKSREAETKNFLIQHVKETTRVRREDEPARLDLGFTQSEPN